LTTLRIHHTTAYRFHRPVSFGPHRLIAAPRESRDLGLLASSLIITPDATVTWAHDVFGNAVATAGFQATLSTSLVIDSVATSNSTPPPGRVRYRGAGDLLPVPLFDNERTDLGALVVPLYADPQDRLRGWAQSFVRSNPTDTLALLKDPAKASHSRSNIKAASRRAPKARSIRWTAAGARAGTLRCCSPKPCGRWASVARIVSGYLYNPNQDRTGSDARARPMPGPKCMSRCRLDHFDRPIARRQFQPDPGRGGARHPAGDAGVRKLRRDARRIRRHDGVGRRHGLLGAKFPERSAAHGMSQPR